MNPPVSISSLAKEIGNYPIAEIAEKKALIAKQGIRVFDFGPGDDPLPIDSSILAVLREKTPNTSRYPSSKGSLELRTAIRNYVSRRFNTSLDDNEVIPVTGSKEGIYHLPALLIDSSSKRRKVLGPALAYPPYIKGTQAVGGEYIPLKGGPEENYLIELGELSEDILNKTALCYLNYPHNPTGATCSLEYLKRQVKIAKKHGFILVSDECYADIYFGETPPPSVLEITTERVLAFHSLSKRSGLTGFRSGFVAGDKALIEAYAKLRNAIGTAPPEPINLAAITAWNDDEHVIQRRYAFGAIRNRFIQFFDEMKIEYLNTDASFYLWAKAPKGYDGKSYSELLQQHGIFIGPAEFFGAGSKEWFRVSLVLPISECEAAFDVWENIPVKS